MLGFDPVSTKPSIDVDVWATAPQEAHALYEEKVRIATKEILTLLFSRKARKEGQVLHLILDGYSYNEIAKMVGCPVKEVYQLRHAGIDMVRANIHRYYDGYENI